MYRPRALCAGVLSRYYGRGVPHHRLDKLLGVGGDHLKHKSSARLGPNYILYFHGTPALDQRLKKAAVKLPINPQSSSILDKGGSLNKSKPNLDSLTNVYKGHLHPKDRFASKEGISGLLFFLRLDFLIGVVTCFGRATELRYKCLWAG